jgi:hypothetical protein
MPPVTASSNGITRQTIDDPELVELIDCLSRFDVLGNAGLLFPPELDPNNAAAEHPKVDIDGLTAELAKWQTWRFQEQVSAILGFVLDRASEYCGSHKSFYESLFAHDCFVHIRHFSISLCSRWTYMSGYIL